MSSLFSSQERLLLPELEERWAQRCRQSLLPWCIEALDPNNQVPARHHRLLISELERVASGQTDRLMVFMPPGSAKTRYASQLFPPFFMVRGRMDVIGASHGSALAETFSGDIIRLIQRHVPTLGYFLLNESSEFWRTSNGCTYRAAGAGGSITGRRADLFVIDDPIKGREDADSLTIRDKVWNWYRAEVITRLKPGARIILIQCMVGETAVMMADGAHKALKDIRPGDKVATYDDGALGMSMIEAHKSQGVDYVFEIRTESGATTRANARHPFLVEREGCRTWVRLQDFRAHERLVRASMTALPTCQKGLGWAHRASRMAAKSRQGAKAFATAITTNSGGRTESALRRMGRKVIVLRTYATGMALTLRSIANSLKRRVVYALFAESLQPAARPNIGGRSFASITTMLRAAFAAFFAITVTTWSERRTTKICSSEQSNISGFTLDRVMDVIEVGRAEVFDLQVARTGNFIADGFVSHNTRWHEDDLAGRLLDEMAAGADQWRILNLPALAEEDDVLGRSPGEPLWPEWEGVDQLQRKRTAIGEREWAALFQQHPRPAEGALFKIGQIEILPACPPLVQRARGWDLAATSAIGTRDPDWTVGVGGGITAEGKYVIWDVQRMRGGPDEVRALVKQTAIIDGQTVRIGIPQDPGQAGKDQILAYVRMLSGFTIGGQSVIANGQTGFKPGPRPVTGDKGTRAEPFASQVNVGNVAIVRGDWNRAFLDEFAAFPSGTHDDQVDACSEMFSLVGLGPSPMRISGAALEGLMQRQMAMRMGR